MRLIDADALERMGYVLTRTYQQDKETMVYETKKLSDVPSAHPESICVAKVTMTDEQVKEAFEKAVCQILAAQPERKKGKWIRENIVLTSNPPQYQWHCSECGKMVHWFTAEVLTDYCPNCGADMRGEQHEND